MKNNPLRFLVVLWAIMALVLTGCSLGTAPTATSEPSSEVEGAQAGPSSDASIIPDEVTLDQLLAKCEDIADDPDYLPALPGVTADGLGGKALAAKDDDLQTVRRGVANGMLEDFVNGGAVAQAYVAEADRAYTLGDLRPTANANFEKMIERLADEKTASEVCDRVATLYAGALEGEYQTIAPGTAFAGLVYSNDYSSVGYACDLYSPPEGVRVLSWTRPVSAEFTGDQSETLDTIKVAIGYRMLVVDKCPVSEEAAADFSGSLLDEPEPEPEPQETETGGSGDAAAGAGQDTTGGSGDAAAGAGQDTTGGSGQATAGGGQGTTGGGGNATTGGGQGTTGGGGSGGSQAGSGGSGTGGSGGTDSGSCGASCGTGGGGGGHVPAPAPAPAPEPPKPPEPKPEPPKPPEPKPEPPKPPEPEPVDVCPNIPGVQETVPPGQEIRDGVCKDIEPDGPGNL